MTAGDFRVMGCIDITTEELEGEFVKIFADRDEWPTKLWVENYHDYHTFVRAVYPGKFTERAADYLLKLQKRLQRRYGRKASVSTTIFWEDAGWDDFAAHRMWIHLQ